MLELYYLGDLLDNKGRKFLGVLVEGLDCYIRSLMDAF